LGCPPKKAISFTSFAKLRLVYHNTAGITSLGEDKLPERLPKKENGFWKGGREQRRKASKGLIAILKNMNSGSADTGSPSLRFPP
jgi:hypothetical protein